MVPNLSFVLAKRMLTTETKYIGIATISFWGLDFRAFGKQRLNIIVLMFSG